MHSTPNLIPVSRCLLLMVCHLQFSSVCVFDVAKDALKKNKSRLTRFLKLGRILVYVNACNGCKHTTRNTVIKGKGWGKMVKYSLAPDARPLIKLHIWPEVRVKQTSVFCFVGYAN